MSVFQTVTPSMQNLDPLKRVNYTFGLVLGVDEFLQEQIYFMEKDHSQYRLAHGYGTVCGLRVQVTTGVNLEVQVSPGVAINPQGQEIHVPRLMCAKLNDWLTANKAALQNVFGASPSSLSLCVVLCYRECPADMVPVPGEPCRTQQDTMAASHIAESFELKLCLDIDQLVTSPPGSPFLNSSGMPAGLCFRPSQLEEHNIREFGMLLQRIRITDAASTFLTRQQLDDLVRGLEQPIGSPAGSPPLSSPPFTVGPLYLHPNDAKEFLRSAFLVWITEVRPSIGATANSSGCDEPGEQCVLLAELSVPINNTWQVAGAVTIDETRRPFLVQTRLLQEAMLCGFSGTGAGGAGLGSVVAAGTFGITAGQALPAGPTYNGLTAQHQPASPDDGTFLLNWTGSPAYVNPALASPSTHTYLVQGVAIARKVPKSPPVTFEVLEFRNQGILVRVIDGQGNATANGFMVEIKELASF
jgi:hypothetical protein